MTTTLELPEKPVEGFYYPTPVTPEEAFVAIGRLRTAARAEIERLIDWLDATDGHMEREPEDEGDDSDMEETADEEPALGFLEQPATAYGNPWSESSRDQSGSQTRLCAGKGDDLEDEHDGAEQDSEDEGAQCEDEGADHDGREPSLGWTDEEAARGRTCAGTRGQSADLEDGISARPPQNRTAHEGPQVRTENGFGRRRLRGLTDEQQERVKDAMRASPMPGIGVY